ncbi:hypothetical protein ACTJIJ_22460 [Niabella sp. 22666]|uniref:hypothetical protein n=1 Tax=Niabella sp. 22666 TaxID=3453954 RepID=UPI003F83E104
MKKKCLPLRIKWMQSLLFLMYGTGLHAQMSGPLIINPNHAANNYVLFQNRGTNVAIIGSDSSISGADPGNFGMYVYNGKDLEFFTGGMKRIVAKANGNIGIGNAIPQHKLDVAGYILSAQSDQEGGLYLGNMNHGIRRFSGTNDVALYTTSGRLLLSANGASANQIAITGNGNLGVGTTTPNEKLDIDGNVKLNGMINWGWTGRSIKVVSPDGGVSQLLQFTNSMSEDHGNPQGGFDFAWHTGASVMRIIDGKVGIGTTTPGEKLAVNGRILAKEIKVISGATTSWPDYVFNSNYKLTPLPELESFIKTHQHLPEIPSAREVAANGIEVGANQALLLKKIEELTLYIIEQNKQLRQYQEKLTAVEKEVQQLKSQP